MSCSPQDDAPLEACGCCEGIAPSTPIAIANRPGLPAIAYRIGTYAQFRDSMLAGLSSASFAALAGLRTRASDDFTIGLIDAVACAADVLTFYQERIANESYLRTATERLSLQELGKLVGYQLRPGVAAETWLAFALETPKAPPRNLPPEPGAFVTGIPEAVTLPKGLKVQSVPGPDEKPQVFETVEAVPARPQWSAMPALPDEDVVPANGATDAWLEGVDTKLKPGDPIVFLHAEFLADAKSDRWDLRIVAEVVPHPEIARTYVRWVVPLAAVGAAPLAANSLFIYALRQRAAIFGHNAPDWPGLTDHYKAGYLGLESTEQLTQAQRKEWPQFDIFGPGPGGLLVTARVSARKAAEILKADLQANADAVKRQGLMAVGRVVATAASLIEKAFSIPAKIGEAVLKALQLLPSAVGQIGETLLAPIKALAGNALGSIQTFLTQLHSSLGGLFGKISQIITAVNNFIPGPGPIPTGLVSLPPVPTWSVSTTGPMFTGNELQNLVTQLGNLLTEIGADIGELTKAGQALRDAIAAAIEAALAIVASAIYTAHMEARLKVSAEMPFATAQTVCDEAEATSNEARTAIPDFVVGATLADPGPGALILLSLAPLGGVAMNPTTLPGEITTLSSNLASVLRDGNPTNLIEAGKAVTTRLGHAFGSFTQALQRARAAAANGVNRAHVSLLERIDEILAGKPAREFPGRATDVVSLDRVYAGVIAPGYAALQTPSNMELYHVTRVAEASRAEFAVSSKSTLLTVDGENLALFAEAVRETTVLVESQELKRARTPLASNVEGDTIDVAGSVPGLESGRRIIVRGSDVQDGHAVVHYATLLDASVLADRTRLQFAPPLPTPLRRTGTVVFGNVALATHGETVSEILGAGDASRPFQRFELKRLPLTYRASGNESGVDSELTVRVGDVEWQERDSLFGAGSDDRVYTIRTDEQGRDWVIFGDGVRGARPATGVNNVRAVYRQGIGRAGNVAAERLTQPMTRPMGLKSVSNPAKAEGGADPQPAEHARRSMPLGTRTLGRAVSLRDYEDFALAFAGVAKAQARMLALPSGPTIAISVAGQDGDAIAVDGPIWRGLHNAFVASGDPHVRIALLSYQKSTFRLGLKLRRDPAYAIGPLLRTVEEALRERFSFDRRELAQPVMQSEVLAAAHAVPGVVAIDLDLLYGGTVPSAQTTPSTQTRLLASPMRIENGVALPAELLTLAEGPFDHLEEM